MKFLAILLLCLGTVAKAEMSSELTLLAGTAITSSDLSQGYYDNNTNNHNFNSHGFTMAAEYAYNLQPTPFFLSAMFMTNDSVLIGGGIDLALVRLGVKFGYGLTSTTVSQANSTVSAKNYGLITGVSAEVKLAPTFGLSAYLISSGAVLGGVSFHF